MKRITALLLVTVLLLTGCGGKESSYAAEVDTTTMEPTESTEGLDCDGTDAMSWYNAEVTDFGLGLLRQSMETGKNALISPVSVQAALAMTANGAEGETLTQMESVLGRNKNALNQWYERDILEQGHPYLHLANAIFIKDEPKLTVKEDFLQTLEQSFRTGIYMTSFNESTLREINLFVEENTNGMVKNVLDEIPAEAILYLVNALAFEAQWVNPYNENSVQEGVFTTLDGREQTVELMYSEEYDAYVETDFCTGFLKNYDGGRYAFAALLPKEGITVEELVDSLSGDTVADLLNYFEEGKVLTAIPKFQTEFAMETGDALKTMGMTNAFDPNKADFSALATYSGNNIYINRILHKTFISVAEQGTRAGAATAVELVAAGEMAPEEIKEVILNRPFFYMIWDKETVMPIFMGTFVDARAEGTSVPAETDEIFYSPAEDPCMIEG